MFFVLLKNGTRGLIEKRDTVTYSDKQEKATITSQPSPADETSMEHSNTPSRKRVRFSVRIAIHEVSNFVESEKDISALFYTRNELNQIRSKLEKKINLLKTKRNFSDYCIRGIEHRINNSDCEYLRQDSVDAVLEEQMIQQQLTEADDERIAQIYRTFSKRASKDAQRRAEEENQIEITTTVTRGLLGFLELPNKLNCSQRTYSVFLNAFCSICRHCSGPNSSASSVNVQYTLARRGLSVKAERLLILCCITPAHADSRIPLGDRLLDKKTTFSAANSGEKEEEKDKKATLTLKTRVSD